MGQGLELNLSAVKYSIFEFSDYRGFLRHVYEEGKKGQKGFTHRSMAAALGFSSPNFVKLVMDGERNLSHSATEKIITAFGFKKKEAAYFKSLVLFEQAKSTPEKNYYFGLLANYRSLSNTAEISTSQYEYYTNWYNAVVRELVVGLPENLDVKELGRCVHPHVSGKDVKKSIQLLKDLKFIKLDEEGFYQQDSPLLKANPKVQNLSIRNFHKKMGELALKALEELPTDRRNISSVTVKISPKGYQKLSERIENFREEIMALVREDSGVRDVYQLNFQMFPLSDLGEQEQRK